MAPPPVWKSYGDAYKSSAMASSSVLPAWTAVPTGPTAAWNLSADLRVLALFALLPPSRPSTAGSFASAAALLFPYIPLSDLHSRHKVAQDALNLAPSGGGVDVWQQGLLRDETDQMRAFLRERGLLPSHAGGAGASYFRTKPASQQPPSFLRPPAAPLSHSFRPALDRPTLTAPPAPKRSIIALPSQKASFERRRSAPRLDPMRTVAPLPGASASLALTSSIAGRALGENAAYSPHDPLIPSLAAQRQLSRPSTLLARDSPPDHPPPFSRDSRLRYEGAPLELGGHIPSNTGASRSVTTRGGGLTVLTGAVYPHQQQQQQLPTPIFPTAAQPLPSPSIRYSFSLNPLSSSKASQDDSEPLSHAGPQRANAGAEKHDWQRRARWAGDVLSLSRGRS